jgi:hypothetical protein
MKYISPQLELPEGSLPTTAETNKDEILSYYKQMFSIRRMEITCDTEYKVSA